MARTLQALRHQEDHQRELPMAPPITPALNATPESLPEPVEEIPFIEVGGKNTPMEASASVLACSPRPAPKLQLHRPELVEPKATHEPVVKTVIETDIVPESGAEASADAPIEPPATIIAFRPLTDSAPAMRPASERIAPELLTFHQPDHAVSRQYEQVAAALGQQANGGRSRVLFFTAPGLETDTSSTVLNLAVVEARKKASRLVVVDARLGDARTTARLGLTGRPGLRDVLGGFCSLQKALVETGIESLMALAAGRENPTPCLIAGDAMLSILRHLKSRFDCVMIDAPAWDGRPDVTALGAACDAVYVVMGKAEAESKTTRELLQLIPLQGGSLKGCILT
jgi:Mrp family chromosome partitioning ATPase